jgi:hypothetical protein
MASEARQLAAARMNEQLARLLLDNPDHFGWSAVVGFYSALHWIDGRLARLQMHPRNHEDRDDSIDRTALRAIEDSCRRLRTIADDSRYRLVPTNRQTIQRRLDNDLAAIRRQVESLTS